VYTEKRAVSGRLERTTGAMRGGADIREEGERKKEKGRRRKEEGGRRKEKRK
jgi:hypothetical protein